MQDSIDSVTNSNVVLEWLDVDVSRTLDDGLANDLVNEFDDRGLGMIRINVGGRIAIVQYFKRAIGCQNLFERLCTDAIQTLDRTKQTPARNQHPFRRLLQELRRELASDRIKKIVGGEND